MELLNQLQTMFIEHLMSKLLIQLEMYQTFDQLPTLKILLKNHPNSKDQGLNK